MASGKGQVASGGGQVPGEEPPRSGRPGICIPIPVLVCLVVLLISLLSAGAVLAAAQHALREATTVSYTPLSGEADWEGDWEHSELGADPSEAGSLAGTDRVTIPFDGTDLALRVRRGGYRGYFFVTVDGRPANRLPQEARGAYLVLTSPDYEPQVVAIPVAGGLDDGPHVAVVVAERGWDQWPLAGWEVSRTPDTTPYRWALAGSGAVGMACLAGLVWWWHGQRMRGEGEREARRGEERERGREREGETGGFWGFKLPFEVPDAVWVGGALVAATVLHLSPWIGLTLAGGLVLFLLVLWRLDLGLALVAALAPFYLNPIDLFGRSFSSVEITTLMCAISWGARWIWKWRAAGGKWRVASGKWQRASYLDLAVLAFVLVSAVSLLVAEYRHVALRELRVLIVEPALFYLMLRTSRLDGRAIWRMVDLFVVGAVLVALIGLAQYAFCDVDWVRSALGDVIRAEGGFHRLRSVYGSPNSVGLYLGRVLPVLAAAALFGARTRRGGRGRRVAYGLAALPVGAAILLSFSKGALFLGVPLSLLVLGMLAGGRWRWAALAAVALAAVAAIPLLQVPRFASLFDTQSGTLFFRLHLWRSSWTMFRDHPWLGVGLDNFLYHYRSRYILPAAWEEPNISQAHNVLLDYATRLGVAGLAVGTWLQVAFWRLALGLRRLTSPDHRALALGLMGAMAGFLAHGLVDASYFLVDLAFAFFLTLGVTQWLAERETNDTSTSFKISL